MMITIPSAVPISVKRRIVMRSNALLPSPYHFRGQLPVVVHATMRLNPAAGCVSTVKKLKTAKTSPYRRGLKW